MQQFRIQRLQAAAGAYDCLVASSPQNIAYLTGGYFSVGQSVSASTQVYAVLDVRGGQVSYVVSVAEIPDVLEFCGAEAKIYCYGPFHFEFESGNGLAAQVEKRCAGRFETGEEALCAAVRAAGKAPAFDETHINFVLAQKLEAALGLNELPPAADIFRQARQVKHPEEIEMLRRSARIAEESLLAALKGAAPGITEEELERRYREETVRRGATPYFFVATAAGRAAYVDAPNTSLVIGRGDMIRFDFGCIYQGFYSDLARTAVLGAPDGEICRAYGAVQAGIEAEFGALRPGVTADALFTAAVTATRAAGLPEYQRSHCGHGIGMEGYDQPSVAAGNDFVIRENMVLCIETPYYRVGWGGVQIEHTVAVTAEGAEYLDSGDSGLIVL